MRRSSSRVTPATVPRAAGTVDVVVSNVFDWSGYVKMAGKTKRQRLSFREKYEIIQEVFTGFSKKST